jgi:hypothetical protein
VNVLWGLFNLIIGYLLFRAGKISNSKIWSVIIFFAGVLIMSVMSSYGFADIHH